MVAYSPDGVLQGITALRSGARIGGTAVFTGDGTPISYVYANRIGDLYIDYTNGAAWIAGATGVSGWIRIGGSDVSIVSFAGIANSATPTKKGGLGVDTTAGKLYVAGGVSASTDWKLVTSA